jgi:hypothetical protein
MRSIALALVVSLSGCSFFLTRGPDNTPMMGPAPSSYAYFPDCTDSMTYPMIDAVVTGLAVLGIVASIADNSGNNGTTSRNQAIGSALVIGGVFGASGYVGYGRVNRCKSARVQFIAANPGYVPTSAPSYPSGGFPTTSPYAQPQAPQPAPPPQQPQPYVPPAPQARPATLGTEGDVCNGQAECSAGLVCASNLCVKPPRPAQK